MDHVDPSRAAISTMQNIYLTVWPPNYKKLFKYDNHLLVNWFSVGGPVILKKGAEEAQMAPCLLEEGGKIFWYSLGLSFFNKKVLIVSETKTEEQTKCMF